MNRFLKGFERTIVITLIFMMVIVVGLLTLELGVLLFRDIIKRPLLILDPSDALNLFGLFLLILIGVELIETIKAYLLDHTIHVEIVIEVGLIAIARKVIVLDLKEMNGLTIISIASLILALAGAYYLEKLGRRSHGSPPKATPPSVDGSVSQ